MSGHRQDPHFTTEDTERNTESTEKTKNSEGGQEVIEKSSCRSDPCMAFRSSKALRRPGAMSCAICNVPIVRGETALDLAVPPFPAHEPMANFQGKVCHPACWKSWAFRERYVE